mmetsp:Transcript_29353/g.42594  ORF Transcript_29353/g.42594 Transcript_29353/m.42594 type:complete len:669 (+) Transcript_29353:117-2123(+)
MNESAETTGEAQDDTDSPISDKAEDDASSLTDERAQGNTVPTDEEKAGITPILHSDEEAQDDVILPVHEEAEGDADSLSGNSNETAEDCVVLCDIENAENDAVSTGDEKVDCAVASGIDERVKSDAVLDEDGVSLTDKEGNEYTPISLLLASMITKEDSGRGSDNQSQRRDMWREISSALEQSVLIAFYAALRRLAREDKLKQPELILDFPVTVRKVIECISINLHAVIGEMGNERYGVFETFLDEREKRLEEIAVRMGRNYASLEDEAQVGVYHFGDEESDRELVYAIFLDSIRKRVTVVFRGTTTALDLKQDLRAIPKAIENPIKGMKGISANVRVHLGFYEYLFANERKKQEQITEDSIRKVDQDKTLSEVERNQLRERLLQQKTQVKRHLEDWETEFGESIESKYDLIMNQAIAILKENPGFKLYITGHSLGGALATLFSANAALHESPYVQKPVTCISFSSPKVGNISFKKTFERMEEDGLIRKVRVLNGLDLIPKTPSLGVFRVLLYVLCPWNVNNEFSHVGIELKLKGTGFIISYDRHDARWLLLADTWRTIKGFIYLFHLIFFLRITKLLYYHTCSEILVRLRNYYEELQKHNIDDLYGRIKKGETGILSRITISKSDRSQKGKNKDAEIKRRKANFIRNSALPTFTAEQRNSSVPEKIE